MLAVSRRGFISASAAVGLVAHTEKLFAQGILTLRKAGAVPKNGAVGLFLSGQRVAIMIRSADRPPIPVLFDTGANGLMIDVGIAKSLGLKRVPNHITKVVDGSTGNSFETFDYIMPDISIDGMKVGDRQVNGYPWIEDNAVGIFGPDLFRGQVMLLDLPGSRVRVFDKASFIMPRHAPTPYLGERGNALPAVEIVLPSTSGGVPAPAVRAKLDTGNNNQLNLPVEYINRLPLMRPPTVVARTTSTSGSRDTMGSQIIGTVKIGPVSLSDPEVIFDGLTPNVGLPVIRRLHVLLDPAAEQGWVLDETTAKNTVLSDYVGEYGVRKVILEGQRLIYRRSGRPDLSLVPLGSDIFDMEGAPNQIWFERTAGRVIRMNLVSNGTQITTYDQNG